jgi:hypothetical protein
MHSNISLGDRALVAIAAHVEVRSVLNASDELRTHGLDDVLIGSYARRVSIWPGKDVDVFGRLTAHTTDSIDPGAGYRMFGRALRPFDEQGRLAPQPRSYKVEFGPGRYPSSTAIRAAASEYEWRPSRVERVIGSLGKLRFAFSVDVVPAVACGEHDAIPELGPADAWGIRQRTGRWCTTDPVALNDLTVVRNRDPRIAGVGVFVRLVKEIKQIKTVHLPDVKPAALFYEFVLHEGFEAGEITGASWADLTSSALSYIATRLATVEADPVCDPVLHESYRPVPPHGDVDRARDAFDRLARSARHAVTTDQRCQAAVEWRQVFGGNRQHDAVFPLPAGCRATGHAMGAAAANTAVGGTAERSFG